MASGFITLPDGTDWSARWTRYDQVLETIMNELSEKGDEALLKGWLKYILPDEGNGDIESGYAFIKHGGEHVLRIIDTRLMQDKFREIFWNTVRGLKAKLSTDSDIGYLIDDLNQSYKKSLENNFKDPEDTDLKEILFLGGYKIGQ